MKYTEQDIDVLARTIYLEARGETHEGRIAVAHVIKERTEAKGRWKDTVLEVCLQPWQFSCWNHENPNYLVGWRVDLDKPMFQQCWMVALMVLHGFAPNPVPGANHYLTTRIKDTVSWARDNSDKVVGAIGAHTFYAL